MAACGSKSGGAPAVGDAQTGDASGDVAPADGATADGLAKDATVAGDAAGADGGDTGSAVQCTGTTPSFPTFLKECGGDGDCTFGKHQINCCGTKVAIGMTASAKPAFDEAEKTCEGQYPGCGCAEFPTTAEDGKTGDIAVHCDAGKCMTFVK
jgi:hypothetical protein